MSGDVLTLHVNQVQLKATRQGGVSLHSPLSWVMDLWSPGVVPTHGGDSSAVQEQLRDVQQIQASEFRMCCNNPQVMDLWIH